MSRGIGIYPGGPHSASSGREGQQPPRLMRVEEIEERLAHHSEQFRQRSRRKRLVLGLLFCVVAAGGLGLIVGHSTHTTPEELTEVLEANVKSESEFSELVDRTLMELWKMEELQIARTRGGR